ncbi:MAG: hypothetical protein PHD32_02450 [Eubacteriales bacterium]|nr:hypothetical protein [Eubacteriales bacterium]
MDKTARTWIAIAIAVALLCTCFACVDWVRCRAELDPIFALNIGADGINHWVGVGYHVFRTENRSNVPLGPPHFFWFWQ